MITIIWASCSSVHSMDIDKVDVLIYAIGQLRADRSGSTYTDQQMAETLNITTRTLNVNITEMVREGYAIRKRKHYRRSVLKNTELTEMGEARLKEVHEIMDGLVLSPENHGISTYLKFNDVLARTINPLERIFLLHMYVRKKKFDLNQYMMNLSTARNELNIVNFLRRLDRSEEEASSAYGLDVFRMTLYGDHTALEAALSENMSRNQIDTVLIHAETLYKQGKLDRSKRLYDHLLADQPDITGNQWFQANLGLAQVIRRKCGPEEAIKHLDMVEGMTEDRLYRTCLLQAKGTCYGMMGDYGNSIKCLSAAIRSYRYFNHPLLLAIALNNRGVTFFMNDRVGLAEKDWSKAMMAARKARSRYVEARLLINLADVGIKSGDLKLADKLLSRAEGLFNIVNDLEGMSGLEFNRALKAIAEKDVTMFRYHFERSESIASPLPPKYERDIRRKVLLERAIEGGMEEIAAFMKGLDRCEGMK